MTRPTPPSPLQTALPATLKLICHPATPCPVPLQIKVTLDEVPSPEGRALGIRYRLGGAMDALLIPAAALPGPADGLWQHTCLEAFLTSPEGPAYREFNFSPSGQWAAYCFSQERQRDPGAESSAPVRPPCMELTQCTESVTLQVTLPLNALLHTHPDGPWLLGISAVIETRSGHLSYWALHHPGPKPDFHHRDSFAWPLALPLSAPSHTLKQIP